MKVKRVVTTCCRYKCCHKKDLSQQVKLLVKPVVTITYSDVVITTTLIVTTGCREYTYNDNIGTLSDNIPLSLVTLNGVVGIEANTSCESSWR